MNLRFTHLQTRFDSVRDWAKLSAVMSYHLDWSVEKCKRRLIEGYSVEEIKKQK